MSKKQKKPEIPTRLNDILGDVYSVVKRIYEAGVADGAEFANMSWVHRLTEVTDPEAFFKLLKEQSR